MSKVKMSDRLTATFKVLFQTPKDKDGTHTIYAETPEFDGSSFSLRNRTTYILKLIVYMNSTGLLFDKFAMLAYTQNYGTTGLFSPVMLRVVGYDDAEGWDCIPDGDILTAYPRHFRVKWSDEGKAITVTEKGYDF